MNSVTLSNFANFQTLALVFDSKQSLHCVHEVFHRPGIENRVPGRVEMRQHHQKLDHLVPHWTQAIVLATDVHGKVEGVEGTPGQNEDEDE